MSTINYDLNKIKALAFDVDGVLSANVIPMSTEGEPMRTVNIKDGYALHLAAKYGIPLAIITGEEILYVGHDIPDIEVMSTCGLPCCPKDAAPEVKSVARYISHKEGGYGCGRDIVEQFLKVKGLWMADEKAFGW